MKVARLYEDYATAERAYYKRSGIFPIMHVIAIRREVYEANPWIAMNLFKAFTEAKRRSVEGIHAMVIAKRIEHFI